MFNERRVRVVGLDNINGYYLRVLKRNWILKFVEVGVYVVEVDFNDFLIFRGILDMCRVMIIVYLVV